MPPAHQGRAAQIRLAMAWRQRQRSTAVLESRGAFASRPGRGLTRGSSWRRCTPPPRARSLPSSRATSTRLANQPPRRDSIVRRSFSPTVIDATRLNPPLKAHGFRSQSQLSALWGERHSSRRTWLCQVARRLTGAGLNNGSMDCRARMVMQSHYACRCIISPPPLPVNHHQRTADAQSLHSAPDQSPLSVTRHKETGQKAYQGRRTGDSALRPGPMFG